MGVLLQNRHLIASESQKKSATEGNHTVFEEEMLAITHGLRDGRQGSHKSTDGSPTMSVGDGQYVLSPPVDFPCMRKEPQTRNIAKKWKRGSDTVRANLEKV